jgi:hypothetical protein
MTIDGMENSEIFKTMKRQWNILITGLHATECTKLLCVAI